MNPLATLPNTEGFRFIGIRHDGTRVACRYLRSIDGKEWRIYSAVGTIPVALAGWEYDVPVQSARCPIGTGNP